MRADRDPGYTARYIVKCRFQDGVGVLQPGDLPSEERVRTWPAKNLESLRNLNMVALYDGDESPNSYLSSQLKPDTDEEIVMEFNRGGDS